MRATVEHTFPLQMAEVVWGVARVVGANSGSGALLRVVVGTIVGTATFVAMLVILGSPDLHELRRRLLPAAAPGSDG